ncbi:MAG: branched-chain amino acid ABC transporter permease [Candidatus Heimdallarchaeota archaeon]|nr:MAG: branched-chain amino acid ABC transporter permease [Candidatus Heimdallarchaeota archaeon]
MDWREIIEDLWDDVTDRAYYIFAVAILILFPFILVTPPSTLPILNIIFNGSRIPVLSDIYDFGYQSGLFGENVWIINIFSLCLIWAIFAASWDFVTGYSGQVSFGHAAFWGFSMYVAYWVAAGFHVNIPIIDLDLGFRVELEPLFALIFGALLAALLAVFLGIISLRVRGFYLAIITLVIPLILNSLANTFVELTGGNYGLQSDVTRVVPLPPLGDLFDETHALNFYIFVLLVFFVAITLMMLIAFSRVGLAFQSIREDEEAAESLGINVRNYKILAFTLSAFFAGIAGGLYAQWFNYVSPTYLESSYSFQVIIMCVIGGVGTITGGIIGAFLLTILVNVFLKNVFRGVHGMDMLSFGILLIITLRYMPYGLARSTKDQKRACVLGILFALAWIIIPSREGWGVELFSSILPNNGNPTDPLSKLISISVTSILILIGKVDNLGQMLSTLTLDNLLTFIALIIIFIFSIPAMIIFLISEIIGIFLFEVIMGINLGEALNKAKFLICVVTGIPFAFYLPKIFRTIRLRYWGVWPSVGRYEPD